MLEGRILYAEDDRETRENYGFVLEAYFTEIYMAADGEEAWRIYRESRPDLLLLDLSMPRLDGLELAERIREADRTTPIVMLTAHSEKERLLRAIPLGLAAYLVKPVEDGTLLATLRELLEKKKTSRIVPLGEGFSWDPLNALVHYREETIGLTKKENRLVGLLAERPGDYWSKEMLISVVWEEESPDLSHHNKLVQLVYRLNKKIAVHTGRSDPWIQNSYARGYRIS